ncbi:aminotransferase class IV [Sinorhizobium meliloti]|uniref:aminotransferase class IV n=1 Tax=Rhizobium meliloti TaxID=382 RepID=UPI00028619CF|nr:aminotransferase class IV [Sinorhizobium meliloti]ASP83110.1 branched-chain amino acid--2-keto-4-methylthiobutyrate aminotransferase [Sinorhizobium meliloti]MQV24907.1 branched-chain amino acid--2-keto-4-methylthiobutyrate aminotransferase [Sinorhizobium meliloti]MQV37423.1 branched-chain amino acid--2-keto-4-methylthiobutyrate aminotransferase [Sinorhizobium meliloti]MQW20084.1 branched-chain amino acid--2-keto-4-methylthiobutyrate aminotransferase [Sinorhizobium meliloti]RVE78966.1 branch
MDQITDKKVQEADRSKWEAGAAYIDGQFMPIGEGKISILDWGYRRSDVVYDVVSAWDGVFFRMDDHLKRFRKSMDRYHFKPQESDEEIRLILHKLMALSGLRSAYVGMDCLRGTGPRGVRQPSKARNYLACHAVPFTAIAPEDKIERGLHMAVSSVPRISTASVDMTAKNFHWGDMNLAMFEAEEKGADYPILLDLAGCVTEGPGFNVFIVTEGKVATPDYNMLEGVSRASALEVCKELGIETEIRKISARELREADEIFITTTAGGVVGASRIDGRIMNNDRPGPISSKVRETYLAKRKSGWHGEPVRYDLA